MLSKLVAATLVALAIPGVIDGTRSVIAQQDACLHGAGETPDERTRRQQALRLTRDINTQQAAAFPRSNGYAALDQLTLAAPVPQGFVVHLATDGRRYAFSVKDTFDTCGFGYFSDDTGRIYVGEGLR
jgi:hypothetical protein